MSWVIRERDTGKVVCELFERRNVAKLNRDKYEAIPIGIYLSSLNRTAKATVQRGAVE